MKMRMGETNACAYASRGVPSRAGVGCPVALARRNESPTPRIFGDHFTVRTAVLYSRNDNTVRVRYP